MAFQAYVDAFNITTNAAGNTVARSGYGFQPKAVVYWWSGRTESTDTAGRATHLRGIGFACSATDRRCISGRSVDALATSEGDNYHANDACIATLLTGGSVDGAADVQSFDSDGQTLVIDNAFSTDLRIQCLALGGSDLTNAETGEFTKATTTGNQDVTSASFQGDCVLFISTRRVAAPPSATTSVRAGFGWALSSSARGCWSAVSSDAAATTITRSYSYAAECIALQDSPATMAHRADFVSFLSNGFRINWTETAGTAYYVFYLLLKGGNYSMGTVQTQTDTSTPITISGLSYAPVGGLLFSHCQAQSTQDTVQTDDRWSMGGFTSTSNRGSQAVFDDDNQADTVVATAVEHDACYVQVDGSGVAGLMDVQSMDSGGVTFIMDDADPAQSLVQYLLFGNTAAAGRSTKNTHPWALGMGLGQSVRMPWPG